MYPGHVTSAEKQAVRSAKRAAAAAGAADVPKAGRQDKLKSPGSKPRKSSRGRKRPEVSDAVKSDADELPINERSDSDGSDVNRFG